MAQTAADVLQATDRAAAADAGRVPLTIRVRRYNPEVSDEPWWDEFEVRMEPTDRLLDALHEVKWHQDGTLALRRSCAILCTTPCRRSTAVRSDANDEGAKPPTLVSSWNAAR